jgi:beta-lactamase regulating signal transducer with metallopeptidase domain
MLAIFVPWFYIGAGVESYVPSNVIIGVGLPSATTMPVGTIDRSINPLIVMVWLVFGVTWLVISILRSVHTKRVWRSSALCGKALLKYGNPAFSDVLHRVRIYRMPNSSSVFATGLWRPEIWIGNDICSASQIETALNHELAHIAANDQFTLFLIVALERLLWWNPLVWLLGRQARRQIEYACDSRCRSLIGASTYRRSLAELFLVQQKRIISLELTLGNESDIINRLEKIEMKHTIKPNHILTLMLAGSLTSIASASFAAQSNAESPTLIQCHELLPEGVQYDFRIRSAIDTREGRKGDLSITLIDSLNPDSHEVPSGAGEFLQCIQKVVGVGEDKDWPET